MTPHWLIIGAIVLGSAARAKAATVGKMMLRLPPLWRRDGQNLSTDPDAAATARWTGAGGKELMVNFWPGLPPTPGGVMVIAHRRSITVAGQRTDLIKTSAFQGHNAQVLVVFLQRGKARYRIVARNISAAAFETILATVVFTQ